MHGPTGIQQQQNPDNAWLYPTQDALGSVRSVVDEDMAVLESRHYEPYSERTMPRAIALRSILALTAVIPVIALAVAAVACTFAQQLGSLKAEEQPFEFTLQGEVDHTWQATLVPSVEYSVEVKRLSGIHPLDQLQVSVMSEKTDIGVARVVAGDTSFVDFVAPPNGQVAIVVYSKIGEMQRDLGQFTVRLHRQ